MTWSSSSGTISFKKPKSSWSEAMRKSRLTRPALAAGAKSTPAPPQQPVWREVALPAAAAQLTSLFFVNAQKGWAVGHGGLILTTNDAGKTWTRQRGGDLPELLVDVTFTGEKTGWVVGGRAERHGGDGFPAVILKTEDGGKHWTRVDELLGGADNRLEFWYVRFRGTTGWILGHPKSFVTIDRGRSWQPLQLAVVNEKRRAGPAFLDQKTGIDVSETTLFRTTDGGRHWSSEDITMVLPRQGEVNTEFFLNKKVGFAAGAAQTTVGRDALVIKTTDGGNSWAVLSRIPNKGYAYSLFFRSEESGWMVTHEHRAEEELVLHTVDGGKTWNTELEFPNRERGHLGSLFFADKKALFVVGPGKLFRRDQ
jgi:photosystem II stability/assembly factor-like uncharacterized protein